MRHGLKSAALIFLTGLLMIATAQRIWAGETEWLDIDSEQIATYEYDGNSILISNLVLREVGSRHSTELNVLEWKFYAKNKVEDILFFDVMLIAYDSDDSILFVSAARPNFFGITSYAKGLIETSQYIEPGSLNKVDRFQLKVIGVRKE
jgi:hypothetical protein